MTVQINYKNGGLKNIIGNLVLFVGEKFNIKPLIKHISDKEFSFVNDLLKTGDLIVITSGSPLRVSGGTNSLRLIHI